MIKYLLISAFLFHFFKASSQSNQTPDCRAIEVEVTSKDSSPTSRTGKISLQYASGVTPEDFKLQLYAMKRAGNRLNLSGTEINAVKPGEYILVVVGKEGTGYCPKQVRIKIN